MDFWDRHGNLHTPSKTSIIKEREGAFSCCVHKKRLLLIWPDYAPHVPELPGGGVDAGENLLQANKREFLEETGFDLNLTDEMIADTFSHIVNFYANDVNEYWIYKQNFYLVHHNLETIFFEAARPTPEKGIMRWVELSDLSQQPINMMHKKALVNFHLI